MPAEVRDLDDVVVGQRQRAAADPNPHHREVLEQLAAESAGAHLPHHYMIQPLVEQNCMEDV
jgi:hypothetical protein